VQSQSGDYSASEGIAAVEYIRTNILKFAKVHEGNLREFLQLNKDKFFHYTRTRQIKKSQLLMGSVILEAIRYGCKYFKYNKGFNHSIC
jgi:hypothetical protein